MTFGDWDLSPSRFREPFRSPGHREWRTASYDWGRRLRRPKIMKTSADTAVTWFPGQDAIEALLKDSPFEKATEYILPGTDEFCVRAGLRPDPKLLDALWTPVETRVGDGATIQFRRPLEAGPATFFRVRQEP